jgi:hypothetical protein
MTLHLSDEETAALAALLKRVITDDRYPLGADKFSIFSAVCCALLGDLEHALGPSIASVTRGIPTRCTSRCAPRMSLWFTCADRMPLRLLCRAQQQYFANIVQSPRSLSPSSNWKFTPEF